MVSGLSGEKADHGWWIRGRGSLCDFACIFLRSLYPYQYIVLHVNGIVIRYCKIVRIERLPVWAAILVSNVLRSGPRASKMTTCNAKRSISTILWKNKSMETASRNGALTESAIIKKQSHECTEYLWEEPGLEPCDPVPLKNFKKNVTSMSCTTRSCDTGQ